MLLFFVTIGAAAGSPRSILGCGWLAIFMIVQLAVHLGIVLAVGRAAGLPMQVKHLQHPRKHAIEVEDLFGTVNCRGLCSKGVVDAPSHSLETCIVLSQMSLAAGAPDSIQCSYWGPGNSGSNGFGQGVGLAGHPCPPDGLIGLLSGHPHRASSGRPPSADAVAFTCCPFVLMQNTSSYATEWSWDGQQAHV